MDIHPPEGPIHSLREALSHIGIVTIGIIIALSLEGALEWRHHRHLVHEAHANIEAELSDNQRELETVLRDLPAHRRGMEDGLKLLAAYKPGTPFHTTLQVGYDTADLDDASWSTAQSTGAVGFMSYGEVKRYSQIYKLQQLFVATQQHLIDNLLQTAIEPTDPRSVAEAVAEVNADRRSLLAVEQVARTLDDVYKKQDRN